MNESILIGLIAIIAVCHMVTSAIYLDGWLDRRKQNAVYVAQSKLEYQQRENILKMQREAIDVYKTAQDKHDDEA